ncbi:hypothetical protein LVJ83_03015 [Uruburuella testudinis]|uniref:Uncharacterized protein n=1 Tax=Uruburuella testudinis TaxID=1282863 RepID=A0ABY4DTU4_9NEIS|nr:hypothetical protein [Uruburuella testudinis]UOO82458.1 hypothetical protein LVJ83_03015 [Uruburuella testudinis]
MLTLPSALPTVIRNPIKQGRLKLCFYRFQTALTYRQTLNRRHRATLILHRCGR